MTEVIRISDKIFLVKEIVDDFNTENSIVYISYNMENSTRSFSPTQKDWEEASKKFPIENLDSIPKLLNFRNYTDNKEDERDQEIANYTFSKYSW